MDTLDQQLIALLRTDARASVATLAHRLGVSRGTVNNRITKLEDSGTIVGYTVRLRPDIEHNEIIAWMSIAVEGNQTREVISILLGEPGVRESALAAASGAMNLTWGDAVGAAPRARVAPGTDIDARPAASRHPARRVWRRVVSVICSFAGGWTSRWRRSP
jgi:DNA-binding Lrp family transcriptional regulator